MLSFDTVADDIKPHSTKSQILIELDTANESLGKALSVLSTIDKDPLDYKFIRREAPSLVIIFIDYDVRKAAVLLTENGFKKIKGINSTGRRFDSISD